MVPNKTSLISCVIGISALKSRREFSIRPFNLFLNSDRINGLIRETNNGADFAGILIIGLKPWEATCLW